MENQEIITHTPIDTPKICTGKNIIPSKDKDQTTKNNILKNEKQVTRVRNKFYYYKREINDYYT